MNLIPGAEAEAFPVKPIETLERLREVILEKIKKGKPRILLIGGGPAGVELAGNIQRLIQRNGAQARIILANSAHRLLPTVDEKTGHLAEQSLSRRGIS